MKCVLSLLLLGIHSNNYWQSLSLGISDLQFSLTTCNTSAKNEADLRQQLQSLNLDVENKDAKILDLESQLLQRTKKSEDLEDQLRWKSMEFENLLDSKEAKIVQLQKNLAVKSEVGRLQQQVQQLYQEREAEMGERMREVSRRARTPSVTSRPEMVLEQETGAEEDEGQPDSLDSWSTAERPYSVSEAVPPVLRSMPNPASTRSKVFRHKLQKTLLQQQSAIEPPFAKEDVATTVPSVGNGSAGVTSRTPSLISLRQHRKSLPHDYKAVVATLPPITGKPMEERKKSSVSKRMSAQHNHLKHQQQQQQRIAYESKANGEAEVAEAPETAVVNAAAATSAGSERPATESFA